MSFNSFEYAVLLPIVLIAYWRLRRRQQNVLLLVASYIFYGAFDWRFCFLMAFSTATDFTVGRLLGSSDDDRRRKRIFAVSLVVNLGILGFFKYYGFFIDSAHGLFDAFGVQWHAPLFDILLPIGISFYTFHGISYTFDVYRREIQPARSIIDFAVFVSFFPQLVAGPIGRAQLQLPQFEHDRVKPSPEQFRSGVLLILLGLVKKVVIADTAAGVAARTFAQPGGTSGLAHVLGIYAFAIQIYGDFGGYTDIARGSARLLGIELIENFRQPYLSRSITEFWRRWHISLSTWLRDYLYVPLGGNRGGGLSTYRNLFLTMLLGGLWHGAAWTFVFWGALHGMFLVAERALRLAPQRHDDPHVRLGDVPRILITFHLVCLAWVFFRADSFGSAMQILQNVVLLRGGSMPVHVLYVPLLVIAVVMADLAGRRGLSATAAARSPEIAQGALVGALVLLLVLFAGREVVPFVYFKF